MRLTLFFTIFEKRLASFFSLFLLNARTFHSPHRTKNFQQKMTSDPATEPKLDEFVDDAEAGDDDDDDLDSLGEQLFFCLEA